MSQFRKEYRVYDQDTEVTLITHSFPFVQQNLEMSNEATVNVHDVGSMDTDLFYIWSIDIKR